MSSLLTENKSPLLNLTTAASTAVDEVAAENVAVQSTATTTTTTTTTTTIVPGDSTTTEKTLRFPVWIQLLGVGAYFSFDIFLRFLYQDVLEGRHGSIIDDEDDSSSTSTSSSSTSYEKPALLTLCCYMMFLLWGPILVFPYLYFYRRMSIQEYYTTEWCGALGFGHAAGQYTIAMGVVLYFANLGYVAGLRYIHASLGSALSQGEAPFTVLLSVLILGRIFGVWEKRGIALCFSGIAMITIPPVLQAYNLTPTANDDQDDDGSSSGGGEDGATAAFQMVSGVISTLVGAFGFGAYQV
jgi:drug/metabolite transporter (DMT)-like permease